MELEKIKNLTDEELVLEEGKAAEQLFRIRFAKSLGKLDGIKNIRPLKLDIARFKTIARQRKIAAAAGVATTTAAKPVAKKSSKATAKTGKV